MTRWLALLALALAYATPAAAQERFRCAVKDLSAAEQALVEQELAAVDAAAGDTSLSAPRETITIPVHWHVITRPSGRGDVSALVPAQMAVLNAAYQRSGFQFQLASLEVIANDAWYLSEQGSVEEFAMKAALRQGGPGDLNVYTTNGDVYLGWATFPIWYPRYSTYDGVVLWWAALPGTGLGGASADEPDGFLTYDQGDTATHEVGHWLGLYHTFQGGCSEPGDFIKSTPAEAAPQFYCAPRDSCGGKKWPGMDPITNYMDYVDDVCMDNFTTEQERRMYKQWKAFRRR